MKNATMGTIKVVSYLRCSDERQGEDRSIEQQRKEIGAWCERFQMADGQKVMLVGEYKDFGMSGDVVEKRMGFKSLLADAKTGAFDGIVVYDLNRLGRFEPMTFCYWLDPVRLAGVRLFTLDRGESNWNDGLTQVMNALETSGNREYLVKLSKCVLRGKKATAEGGNWAGGVAPFGYKSVPDESAPPRRDGSHAKKLVIVPERAAVVVEIFERYGRGDESMNAIARDLVSRGVPGPSEDVPGRRMRLSWGRWTLRAILDNRAYTGSLEWNKVSFGKYHSFSGGVIAEKRCLTETPKREKHQASERVVRKNTHEAIVSEDLFELVQRKIASRKGTHTAGGAVGKAANTHGTRATIFSGLVYCQLCGAKMHGLRQDYGSRLMLYACEGRRGIVKNGCKAFRTIPEADLVQAASAFILSHVGKSTIAEWEAEATRRLLAAAKVDPKALVKARAELAALDAKLDGAEDAFLSAPPSLRGGLAAKLEKWKAERDRKREQVKELEARAVQTADIRQTAKAVALAMSGLRDALADGDDAMRKAVFRLVVERIDVAFADTRLCRGKLCSEPCGVLVHIREETFSVGALIGPVLSLLGLHSDTVSTSKMLCPKR